MIHTHTHTRPQNTCINAETNQMFLWTKYSAVDVLFVCCSKNSFVSIVAFLEFFSLFFPPFVKYIFILVNYINLFLNRTISDQTEKLNERKHRAQKKIEMVQTPRAYIGVWMCYP